LDLREIIFFFPPPFVRVVAEKLITNHKNVDSFSLEEVPHTNRHIKEISDLISVFLPLIPILGPQLRSITICADISGFDLDHWKFDTSRIENIEYIVWDFKLSFSSLAALLANNSFPRLRSVNLQTGGPSFYSVLDALATRDSPLAELILRTDESRRDFSFTVLGPDTSLEDLQPCIKRIALKHSQTLRRVVFPLLDRSNISSYLSSVIEYDQILFEQDFDRLAQEFYRLFHLTFQQAQFGRDGWSAWMYWFLEKFVNLDVPDPWKLEKLYENCFPEPLNVSQARKELFIIFSRLYELLSTAPDDKFLEWINWKLQSAILKVWRPLEYPNVPSGHRVLRCVGRICHHFMKQSLNSWQTLSDFNDFMVGLEEIDPPSADLLREVAQLPKVSAQVTL
jgi:hypothetical protein